MADPNRKIAQIVFDRPPLRAGRFFYVTGLGVVAGAVLGVAFCLLMARGDGQVSQALLARERWPYFWASTLIGLLAGLILGWSWKRSGKPRLDMVEPPRIRELPQLRDMERPLGDSSRALARYGDGVGTLRAERERRNVLRNLERKLAEDGAMLSMGTQGGPLTEEGVKELHRDAEEQGRRRRDLRKRLADLADLVAAVNDATVDSVAETRARAADGEVPHSFYALAMAPTHVVVAKDFTLTAGTTGRPPTPDASPFVVPKTASGEYTVQLTLHAVGFEVKGGATIFDLRVTATDPYPTVDIHLTPELQVETKLERTIALFYAVDAQVIGSVEKKIWVHDEADDETQGAQQEVWRQMFSAPLHDVPPDLTVMITDDGSGNLAWSFITPHDVPVTRKALHQSVQQNAKSFAELIVSQANARDGKGGDLYPTLVGLGMAITKVAQQTLWLVLKRVAKEVKKPPTLLLISNEPYIPWELATMAEPLDDALPPFLGVQTCMGRWIIGDRLPPPRDIAPQRATVVSGKYTRLGWRNLPSALEEAETIAATYRSITKVEATTEKILAIFETQPAPGLLHFSMHGQWDDDSVQNGLITIEGGAIAPQTVAGAIDEAVRKGTPRSAPFVFLNACQVAGGIRILGDYGGLASAFINGGATAVIAPLWAINDGTAKQVALDFYQAILVANEPPAEVIRSARAKFNKLDQTGTYLAYQFFGHPSLRVDGSALRP